jgi:predicted NBD/HSP70 family sugar kinase
MATSGDLFVLIRDGMAQSRPELGRLTGLSRTAVATRLEALLATDLITETRVGAGGVGRPAVRVEFSPGAGLVLAAAIGRSRTRLAVCDLAGMPLASSDVDHLDSEIGVDPDRVLPRVAAELGRLRRHVATKRPVFAVGVSIPGIVDAQAGTSVSSPIMRGWHRVPIAAYFDVDHAPVVLENDTNVIAYAEETEHLAGTKDALILKASTGLGAAIVAGGRLQHGAHGAAGDLGHVRYRPAEGIACRCGNTGCLESVAGGWAIVRDLAARGRKVTHVRDVVALALDGDLDARAAIRASGHATGEVLAAAVTLLDPGLIVVGGDMAPAHELFVAGLRETLFRDATLTASHDLRVVAATHGADSGVRGTAAVALSRVLNARAIDERILRG